MTIQMLLHLQTMLQNNASAAFLNNQLSGTEWRVSDVSDFLSKAAKDPRRAGSPYTWRDVFNETDHAIHTISRFMEVGFIRQRCAIKSSQMGNLNGLELQMR